MYIVAMEEHGDGVGLLSFGKDFAWNMIILVLIIVYHLILIMARILT